MNRTIAVPILKYVLLAGSSLLALIFVAGHLSAPTPSASPGGSTSLEVLRKMANHGELRPFASAAAAGPFIAMPEVAMPEVGPQPTLAAADGSDAVKPVADAPPPALLDAQARLSEADVSDKPARAHKKIASRKPKQPRIVYVENVPRASGGFFGAFQSW